MTPEAARSAVSLNFSDEQITHAGTLLTEFLRTFERSIGERSVLPPLDRASLSELLQEPFPQNGVGLQALFDDIEQRIVPNSTATGHPRFLAYVLGPANGIAPFAEAIAATLNQNCNFWQLSPAASVIEQKVISWLASLFDCPDSAGGIMTSGGSMATQIALSAAITDRHPGDARRTGLQSSHPPMVLYTSAEAHGCVAKAAATLGLGLDNVRTIPVDESFRMRLDLLQTAIAEDRRSGKQPFCIVATAGTINTGAIDPIAALADLSAQEELWLHVDGAFGALFALAPTLKDELLPCGQADSLALDPHKLLFAPLEAGSLVVRDRDTLRRAFDFSASYLTVEQDPLLTNFMEYGPQLSRDFKAFKVWCSLQAFGLRAFTEAVEHTLDIARYLKRRVEAERALALLAPVTLTAVCLRLTRLDDAGNHRVLSQLVEDGGALLGPVRIGGHFGIRACITNFRTTREDVDAIVDTILRLGARAERGEGTRLEPPTG